MTASQIQSKLQTPFYETMEDEQYQKRLREIYPYIRPAGRLWPKGKDDYTILIKGILRSVLEGREDYLFSEQQIIDLLPYAEKLIPRGVRITYLQDSCWGVAQRELVA